MALSIWWNRKRASAGNGEKISGLIVAVLLDYHSSKVASSCKVCLVILVAYNFYVVTGLLNLILVISVLYGNKTDL
jgi:hypothetical protein